MVCVRRRPTSDSRRSFSSAIRRCMPWSGSTLKRFVSIALTSGLLFFLAGSVLHAEEIEGTIVRTLLLSEDTWLVGDVTCRV